MTSRRHPESSLCHLTRRLVPNISKLKKIKYFHFHRFFHAIAKIIEEILFFKKGQNYFLDSSILIQAKASTLNQEFSFIF